MADAPRRRGWQARRKPAAMPQRRNDSLRNVTEGDLGIPKQNVHDEAGQSTGEDYAERLESLDPCFHARLLRVHVRTVVEPKRVSQNSGSEPHLHSIGADCGLQRSLRLVS